MDKIKKLKSLFNQIGDEILETENLIIQQKDNAYFIKITTEAKGTNIDLENQPLQKLVPNNPLRLDKEKLQEQIMDWIQKVNASRKKTGFKFSYDTETVLIHSKVFVENIWEELLKKKLLDSLLISSYRFDTMVWTVNEYLYCDRYDDGEVYLSIKMKNEIDSDDNGSVLKRYGKIPEGLTEEEIESEDFQYILPDEINGERVWYDGFILWSEKMYPSHLTEILPLKVTKNTSKDDINKWLKGDKVHYSYLSKSEITEDEFIDVKNCLKYTI